MSSFLRAIISDVYRKLTSTVDVVATRLERAVANGRLEVDDGGRVGGLFGLG